MKNTRPVMFDPILIFHTAMRRDNENFVAVYPKRGIPFFFIFLISVWGSDVNKIHVADEDAIL